MPKVRDLMTPEVLTVHPEMTLREAMDHLVEEGISGAPVVSGAGRVMGVVSATDILDLQASSPGVPSHRDEPDTYRTALQRGSGDEDPEDEPSAWFVDYWMDAGGDVFERMESPDSPEWDFLAEHLVREVMTQKVLSIGADEEVRAAAALMAESGVHRLLVLDDAGALEGILTTTDIVRGVADGRIG